MALFFIVFFAVYGAINYYIFIRGWQALSALPFLKIVYLILFLISALSYFLSRIIAEKTIPFLYDLFLGIGSFWFAFFIYFFLFIILIDFLRLVNSYFDFLPAFLYKNYEVTKQLVFLSIFLITSIIVFLGYLNTRNIKINSYEITLRKGFAKLDKLEIALVSDFHMTPLNNGPLLRNIVNKINSINPDIVLMPGDIVDDKVSILRKRGIGSQFTKIKSKYGVYASAGNHEFISGIDQAVSYIEEHKIKLLRDSVELVDSSFYIIGRDDIAKKNFTGSDRKSLQEIIKNTDKNYPFILLDHSPVNLDEAVNNNIDLQLSGHTHHGQIFPGNLITSLIYEVSWGYLEKGKTRFYVTSGAGTWGPPVRIGSDSEIVHLIIKFKD